MRDSTAKVVANVPMPLILAGTFGIGLTHYAWHANWGRSLLVSLSMFVACYIIGWLRLPAAMRRREERDRKRVEGGDQ
jgi:hypothetical protein